VNDLDQALTALDWDPTNTLALPVTGGSINQAWQCQSREGTVFIKTNASPPGSDFFEAEARGLAQLRETRTLKVPKVHAVGQTWLALEWLTPGQSTTETSQELGRGLAALHGSPAPTWGHGENNYMGALPQPNSSCGTFSEFFWSQRLEPLISSSPHLDETLRKRFSKLQGALDHFINVPGENPCWVHGDLWSGNALCLTSGEAAVVDPAVGASMREVDLAMTRLFGGFDDDFYAAYEEVFPLSEGWEDRVGILNLYPLMVHVNLFGPSYLTGVRGILGGLT